LFAEETKAYIAERLRIAGASEPVLAPDAVQLVHRCSRGIPRLINLICEHALITAYVEQMKPIPSCIVESVCTELELDQQPFLISPMTPAGLPESAPSTAMFNAAKTMVNVTDFLKEREL
jgi:hypothetical protein